MLRIVLGTYLLNNHVVTIINIIITITPKLLYPLTPQMAVRVMLCFLQVLFSLELRDRLDYII